MSESIGTPSTLESRWFKIVLLIGSGIAAGVALANVIYYSKIRKNPVNISANQATTMLVVNILVFIVSLVLFIWAIWAIVVSRERREELFIKAKTAATGASTQAVKYLQAPGGFIPGSTTPIVPVVPKPIEMVPLTTSSIFQT